MSATTNIPFNKDTATVSTLKDATAALDSIFTLIERLTEQNLDEDTLADMVGTEAISIFEFWQKHHPKVEV